MYLKRLIVPSSKRHGRKFSIVQLAVNLFHIPVKIPFFIVENPSPRFPPFICSASLLLPQTTPFNAVWRPVDSKYDNSLDLVVLCHWLYSLLSVCRLLSVCPLISVCSLLSVYVVLFRTSVLFRSRLYVYFDRNCVFISVVLLRPSICLVCLLLCVCFERRYKCASYVYRSVFNQSFAVVFWCCALCECLCAYFIGFSFKRTNTHLQQYSRLLATTTGQNTRHHKKGPIKRDMFLVFLRTTERTIGADYVECLLESSLCKENWKFGVNKVFPCFVSVAGSCNSYCSEALTSSGSCIDRDILCKESPDCIEV